MLKSIWSGVRRHKRITIRVQTRKYEANHQSRACVCTCAPVSALHFAPSSSASNPAPAFRMRCLVRCSISVLHRPSIMRSAPNIHVTLVPVQRPSTRRSTLQRTAPALAGTPAVCLHLTLHPSLAQLPSGARGIHPTPAPYSASAYASPAPQPNDRHPLVRCSIASVSSRPIQRPPCPVSCLQCSPSYHPLLRPSILAPRLHSIAQSFPTPVSV